ncbi:phage-like protein [Yersinia massiliensis]|uniref:phage-like protein n=1 Tax=Yersinia massiliensis TaxID=419257 RepID=UPI0005E7D12C|nr:phage-like protein [Yersinia massiliensis]CNI74784.1 phage-like protein [Yersinia massiliensis]
MNEKPILFNSEMVNAILSGRKTQTRRIMKVQPSEHFHPQTIHGAMDFTAHWYTPGVIDKDGYLQPARKDVFGVADEGEGYTCPLGAVGDQLWVREAFAAGLCTESTLAYRATHKKEDLEEGWGETIKWTPSIHMPRWASRINLLITGVRVERLNDISEQDAISEGLECYVDDGVPYYGPFNNGDCRPDVVFRGLWDSIYGQKEGENWQANPWVWVIEFERMEAK